MQNGENSHRRGGTYKSARACFAYALSSFSNFKTLETPHRADSRNPHMALREPQFRSSGDPKEGSDAEVLEELEADVKDMAKKLLHYRSTLPVQLKSKFTSILSSQRPPNLEFVSGSDPQASGDSGQFSFFFFFFFFCFLKKIWLKEKKSVTT